MPCLPRRHGCALTANGLPQIVVRPNPGTEPHKPMIGHRTRGLYQVRQRVRLGPDVLLSSQEVPPAQWRAGPRIFG